MKKILIIALILIAGIVAALIFSLDTLVKEAINEVAPQIMGAEVSVEDVDISITNGQGSIKNLVVGNPQGFKSDYAFSLGKIDIKIDISSVQSDMIIINEISITDPSIIYEIALGKTNIGELQKNIMNYTGSEGDNSAQAIDNSADDNASKKKVIIENIYIKGMNVKAAIMAGQGASISVPDIHLQDIGKDNGSNAGVSFAEAGAVILQSVTQQLSQANLSGMVGNFEAQGKEMLKSGDGAIGAAQDIMGNVKGLLGN